MAKKKTPPRKAKPSIETVQEGFRATDLLRVEVCNPIKEKLDKIEVCKPNIVELCNPHRCIPSLECVPSRLCSPHIVCKPDWECLPNTLCRPNLGCIPAFGCKPEPPCFPKDPCRPGIWCKPDVFCMPRPGCTPEMFELPGDYRERAWTQTVAETTPEMAEMVEELRTIRAEIEDLKKKIK